VRRTTPASSLSTTREKLKEISGGGRKEKGRENIGEERREDITMSSW